MTFLRACLPLALVLLATGCATHHPAYPRPEVYPDPAPLFQEPAQEMHTCPVPQFPVFEGLPENEIGIYQANRRARLEELLQGTKVSFGRTEDGTLLLPFDRGFVGNTANLSPEIRPALDAVARTMLEFDKTFLDIRPFAREAGYTTTEHRVQAVADYLVAQGVEEHRINTLQNPGWDQDPNYAANTRARGPRLELTLSTLAQ